MQNRFTERAQEALQRAQRIMFAKQHFQLDVEHIFLALLQQRSGLPASIIKRLGGDVELITRRIHKALDSMPHYDEGQATTGYIALRAQRVLQRAAEQADRLNDKFISTEHLLLAIANEPGGTPARILQEAGIDYDKALAALLEIRGERANVQQALEPATGDSRAGSKILVTPPGLVEPRGFSHGIIASGRMLFLAGQTALDQEGRVVAPGDLVAQYRQVLSNLKQVVEAAGGEMQDIVKINIFVKDRDDYLAHLKPLGEAHRSFFGNYYPATSLFEISRFFQDEVLVEIEGIAVLRTED
jgi:enamine deaminase RidA (YjgF/YER057c/UK114 family)